MNSFKPLALRLALLAALCAGPAFAEVPQKAPEIATAYAEKPGWAAQQFMVAAANPLAVEAGMKVLRQGGSAVDAAVAVQAVLGLVEPQSSGLGGGAVDHARQTRADHEAVARQPLGVAEQVAPGQPAVILLRHGQHGDRPRRPGRTA